MPDVPDPPRKFYQLKPREFEAVNEGVKPPDAVPATGEADAGVSRQSEIFEARALARAGAGTAPLLGANATANRPNDVHAMLRAIHEKAEAAGLNNVTLPARRRSRRWRDYVVLMIAGNLFIATVYSAEMLLGFQVQALAAKMPQEFMNLVRYALAHPASFIMAPVGMVFYSGCLTWLMFGIMDDY